MNPITRRRQRTFNFKISLPPLDKYAWDVVNSIERKKIRVVDPNDCGALDTVINSSGEILLEKNAKLSVPLADWLTLGCQRVRWEEANEEPLANDAFGCYRSNEKLVFGRPYDESEPLGPSVFVGEIILPRRIQYAWINNPDNKTAISIVHIFQFILAHEFVHVFDNLMYLIPAAMDWRSFWKNVLKRGNLLDILNSNKDTISSFIDDYSNPNELECIRYWWSSRAEEWFQTRQVDWSKLFKINKE